MQDILGSLPAILKNLDTGGQTVEPVVFAAWKRVVDGVLAEHVVPVRLEKNRLIAAVSNETWRRNVANLGPALVEKLNRVVGSQLVNFVEFQIDAAVVREHRRNLKTAADMETDLIAAASAQITPGLREAAGSIADEALRNRFLAAAGSSLARNCRNRER